MNNFIDKFRRFMTGRYGTDELNRFLSILILVLIVVNLFVKSSPIYWLELIVLGVIYLRMFSKNTGKRFQENQKYLYFCFHLEEALKKLQFQIQESRRYKIFRCPGCRQKIRIPRGHGKIEIHCRSCGRNFMGKS